MKTAKFFGLVFVTMFVFGSFYVKGLAQSSIATATPVTTIATTLVPTFTPLPPQPTATINPSIEIQVSCIAFVMEVKRDEFVGLPEGQHIFIMRTNSNLPEAVDTNLTAAHSDVSWSPNGQYLAFVSNQNANGSGETDVFIIRPNGGDLRQITGINGRGDGYNLRPVWSPDSRQLAYISTNQDITNGIIYKIDLFDDNGSFLNPSPVPLGGDLNGVTHLSATKGSGPALLAYTNRSDDSIKIMDWNGNIINSVFTPTLNGVGKDLWIGPDWVPNGTDFFYTTYNGGYSILFNSMSGIQYESPNYSAHSPSISDSGRYFVYITSTTHPNETNYFNNLHLFDIAANEGRNILNRPRNMYGPSWSSTSTACN